MFQRLINLPKNQSFFLFGPRGTGKSTLLRLNQDEKTLYIDLLLPKEEDYFFKNPQQLIEIVKQQQPTKIIIDEIQNVPKLLNVVHSLIESHGVQFMLTGSSARKIKRGNANLLAGRAVVRELFPLTYKELEDSFDLNTILEFGSLPKVFQLVSEEEKNDYLESYGLYYLKEEIFAESIIRLLEPFRKFLPLAAQCCGKIVNIKRISDILRVDSKTVKNYYQILEDTLLGFYLEPFHTSLRWRLAQFPKFYFFDTGITRALAGWLKVKPVESTSYYGDVFEHFCILELLRKHKYLKTGAEFYYFSAHDGPEIDLVLKYPQQEPMFIEIKSTNMLKNEHLYNLEVIAKEFPKSKLYIISREIYARKIGNINCLPWREALEEL